MRALTLICLGPAIACVRFVSAIVDVVQRARREARLQRLAIAATEQHKADVRAELARQRVKVAEGMRRPWGAN